MTESNTTHDDASLLERICSLGQPGPDAGILRQLGAAILLIIGLFVYPLLFLIAKALSGARRD